MSGFVVKTRPEQIVSDFVKTNLLGYINSLRSLVSERCLRLTNHIIIHINIFKSCVLQYIERLLNLKTTSLNVSPYFPAPVFYMLMMSTSDVVDFQTKADSCLQEKEPDEATTKP